MNERTRSTAPPPLGTIYVERAKVYNKAGRLIGTCMDTPNAIAKAFMECPEADSARGLLGWVFRRDYGDRMNSYNVAASCFVPYTEPQEGKDG